MFWRQTDDLFKNTRFRICSTKQRAVFVPELFSGKQFIKHDSCKVCDSVSSRVLRWWTVIKTKLWFLDLSVEAPEDTPVKNKLTLLVLEARLNLLWVRFSHRFFWGKKKKTTSRPADPSQRLVPQSRSSLWKRTPVQNSCSEHLLEAQSKPHSQQSRALICAGLSLWTWLDISGSCSWNTNCLPGLGLFVFSLKLQFVVWIQVDNKIMWSFADLRRSASFVWFVYLELEQLTSYCLGKVFSSCCSSPKDSLKTQSRHMKAVLKHLTSDCINH